MAAIALQRRVNSARAIRNPSVVQLFSSSSSSSTSNPNVQDQNQNTTQSPSQSSFSSYFSDVKASLKQQSSQQQQQRQPLRRPFSTPLSAEKPPSKISSLQEIRKNLSEFHRGAKVPPPAGDKSSSSSSRPYLSFEEVYKRNIISKGGEEPSNKLNNGGKPSIQDIRDRIKQLQSKSNNQTNNGGAMSLSKFTESFKLRPLDPNQKESPTVIGGGKYNLPASVFGKEMNKSVESSSNAKKKKIMKKYSSKEELGSKLRRLRPERDNNNNNKWFSLGELNNRLMKLNEIEQKESESRNLVNFPSFKEIVQSLQEIEMCEEEKANKSIIQRLEMLSQIGGTPKFMLEPPKENLVEKYFHPDNMSASEKMKLELQKVRDEFKMSESDCGSSRVQVAVLTTKIKHLSTTLHKKDKHSRKGLQAMVQKRKKLLKYLRRTDWDSYCLVLSKLGLRDNPDYKN